MIVVGTPLGSKPIRSAVLRNSCWLSSSLQTFVLLDDEARVVLDRLLEPILLGCAVWAPVTPEQLHDHLVGAVRCRPAPAAAVLAGPPGRSKIIASTLRANPRHHATRADATMGRRDLPHTRPVSAAANAEPVVAFLRQARIRRQARGSPAPVAGHLDRETRRLTWRPPRRSVLRGCGYWTSQTVSGSRTPSTVPQPRCAEVTGAPPPSPSPSRRRSRGRGPRPRHTHGNDHDVGACAGSSVRVSPQRREERGGRTHGPISQPNRRR